MPKKSASDAPKLASSSAVFKALRQHFDAPAWAVFGEVSNATGHRASRWADALAVSLWPSRGLHFHGIEIKVSRNDVIRELRDPAKADAIASYCDFWWMAVGSADIVKVEELPAPWGLLVPVKRGELVTLRIAKQAVALDPKPLDRTFVTAILRRASEQFDPESIRKAAVANLRHELYLEVEETARKQHERELETLNKTITSLRESERGAREQLATIALHGYGTKQIEGAFKLLHALSKYGWDGAATLLDHAAERSKRAHAGICEAQTLLATLRGDAEDRDIPPGTCTSVTELMRDLDIQPMSDGSGVEE